MFSHDVGQVVTTGTCCLMINHPKIGFWFIFVIKLLLLHLFNTHLSSFRQTSSDIMMQICCLILQGSDQAAKKKVKKKTKAKAEDEESSQNTDEA